MNDSLIASDEVETNAKNPLPSDSHTDNELLAVGTLLSVPDREQVRTHALVMRSEVAIDRVGHPYLLLTIRGTDGRIIDVRWWKYPYPPDRRPQVGQIYEFMGQMETFNGERQVRLTKILAAPGLNLSAFIKSTWRSLAELCGEFDELLNTTSPDITNLIHEVLSGEVYNRYCIWPAAQRHHGAVRHGLLAHSLGVSRIACSLPETYGTDGLIFDRDLVVAASLLHDVGKVWTLPEVAGSIPPKEAHTFDHITVSVLMVRDAGRLARPALGTERLDHLLHIILAHHGKREWGAAVEPQTVEAWLVHLADLAEARLWSYSAEEESPFREQHG